jgi:hypothetical protein
MHLCFDWWVLGTLPFALFVVQPLQCKETEMNETVVEAKPVKIGFFKGIGMMWTSFVRMVVTFFQAGEDVAGTLKEGTGVMRKQVSNWSEEMQADFDAEMAEKVRQIQAPTVNNTVTQ